MPLVLVGSENEEVIRMIVTIPDLKTALPGPKAKALIDRDAKVVSTSYTRDYPLVMARGEGAAVIRICCH